MRNGKSISFSDSRGRCVTYLGRVCFSVLFAVIAIMATAQGKSVSGTVTDEAGDGIIGVTVMVKGTKTGTATDIDGRYVLNTPPIVR